MSVNGANQIHINVRLEDVTLAGTPTVFCYRAPTAGQVVGCYALDTSAVTNNATDYMTLTLTNQGSDALGTTSMGVLTSNAASGNMVAAGVPGAFTLTSDVAYSAGDIISIVKTEGGAGKDFTAGSIVLCVASAN